MIRFLKRLWNDRRGNAIIIAGAAMPLVVGAAGLATDTIQWTLWQRELQRAADSAAFAGVYALGQSGSASTAVNADLTRNNHSQASLLAGYPQIAFPTAAGWTNAVKVTLKVQKPLGFSSLFLSSAPIITATATAAQVDQGSYCVVALNGTTNASLTIGGSSSISMGCGAISNSTNSSAAVATNGASYNFTASPVAAVGGLPDSINGATDLQPHHVAMSDPYAGKYPTTVPTPCNGNTNGNQTTFSPGCYKTFSFTGNATYTLQPGVYILNNTNFSVGGTTTIVGTGVTIILTGTSPGTVSTNGNSTIKLTAPTTGTYADMLFIGTATGSNTINGNNSSYYDGAFYFPNGTVNLAGSSAGQVQCAMVVANFVTFTGNSQMQNTLTRPDGTPCQANTQVQANAVKLVA